MKKSIAQTVTEIVSPYAKELGLEIYDTEYVKEGADYFLRIYIDKPDGEVNIDDCENFSRAIDPVLDEADPIKDSYYLEVSSVGLDRPLKTEKDFMRFMGQKIDVRLFKAKDGIREFYGVLCHYCDGSFTVETESGDKIELTVKEASLIRPHLDF
jgi:ribosome maturation factor RimP